MTRRGHAFDMHCATFTKAEIQVDEENRVMLFEDKNDPGDEEKYIAQYCSLLHTTIRLQDDTKVHVLNHHGRLVKGTGARMKNDIADYNFSRISEYISTLSGHIILSGDFNLWKEASSLLPLKRAGLINLNDVYNISTARNEFAWAPGESVSHIFINDQIDIMDYRVAQDNVSDHLPLVMTCRVRI
jgi:endonuclease/exonuclease/phosphatase (EEP) superfamily protein YafD